MASSKVVKYIGLCGKMGTGKDYIASNIILPFLEKVLSKKVIVWSFADQLKVNAMVENGLKYEDLYIAKTKESRNLLQQKGTEKGRNIHGKDIWVRYLDAWSKILQHKGYEFIIIPDVRFIEEIHYLKAKSGVIFKIDAPYRNQERLKTENTIEISQHASESNVDQIGDDKFDLIITNDKDNFVDTVSILSLVKQLNANSRSNSEEVLQGRC